MKKFIALLLLVLLPFSAVLPQQVNAGVISSILKLQNYLTTADENILRYQNSIDRCDRNIRNTTELLNTARKDGDAQSADELEAAIQKLNTTKQKYGGLITITKEKKIRFQGTINALQSKMNTPMPNFTGAILSSKGDVAITRANGKKIKLQDMNISSLEDGDVLTTGDGGRVELQCVDGRGNLIIGENSKVSFQKKDSVDVINILDGRIRMDVEKLEAYKASLVKGYHNVVAAAQSPDSVYEVELKKLKARVQKKFEVRVRVSAVLADRGTEFTVQCLSDTSAVVVSEGCIEMKSLKDAKTVLINGGQTGLVTMDGKLLDVQPVELKNLNTWWKDEE